MDPNQLTTTQSVDPVFFFIFGVCLALLAGITATMIWFVIRYHRSRSPEPTSRAAGNIWLEIVWTALPTVLVMAMFWYGWAGYRALRTVPAGALPVTATARMWSWEFSYANGATSPRLRVPAGKPVLVNLVAKDVIHGFYIPAFRIKRDAVPGMASQVWFMAPKPGSYDIFCSQYCGTGHSTMITTVEALPEAEFAAWLKREVQEKEAERGEESGRGRALLEKFGCLACHSLDGSSKVGPGFKGIWGRTETVLTGNGERSITVDEAYLRRSILEPKADIVKGFPPVMPVIPMKDDELAEIIAFLKGVR